MRFDLTDEEWAMIELLLPRAVVVPSGLRTGGS